jgi:hypothetical protein
MTIYIPDWEYAAIWFCLSFTVVTGLLTLL